jgi:endonuclease/exonuclease/phosphatase family metal-dependent hydrolase
MMADKSLEFRLGSYNLRLSALDTDPDNRWSVRKPRLMDSIRNCAFDVAGLQEVSIQMKTDLNEQLGDTYSFWFFSPYSQSGEGEKSHGIMFRTSDFSISGKHFFWVSDTPEECSLADVGPRGNYRRGGCCAVLKHKSSGIRFFLMSTHACFNEEPNARYAQVYSLMEKRYNPDALPSFFVGDMNAVPAADASNMFRKYWNDACSTVDASMRTGLQNTFNGYIHPLGSSRIDYIYFRGTGIEIRSYTCDGSLYGGRYASDHFPISADIKITRK